MSVVYTRLLCNSRWDGWTLTEGQRMRAMEVLTNLLENASPAIRLQAVKLILEATSKTPTPTATDTRFAAVLKLLETT